MHPLASVMVIHSIHRAVLRDTIQLAVTMAVPLRRAATTITINHIVRGALVPKWPIEYEFHQINLNLKHVSFNEQIPTTCTVYNCTSTTEYSH